VFLLCLFALAVATLAKSIEIIILDSTKVVHLLEKVAVFSAVVGRVTVSDAKGKVYFSSKASQRLIFKADGAA